MAQESRVVGTRAWALLVTTLLSRAYRVMLLTLVAIATVPTFFGWDAYVTKSGSMEPSIAVGDVVLARQVSAQDEIAAGRVYVFNDPAAADRDRLLVHRIVERGDDGAYVTAGDANASVDSTPVDHEQITGRGILLVPYVGLPVVWFQSGAWPRTLVWLVLTVAAFLVATWRPDGRAPRRPKRGLQGEEADPPVADNSDADNSDLVDADRTMLRRGAPTVTASLAAVLLGITPTANATFTDQTVNGSNTWHVGTWVHQYVSEVLEDKPFGLWLLDESRGSWAADRSGADRTGRYHGIVSYGEPGGLPNNPGTSIRPGTGRVVLGPSAVRVPSTHTIELWFRTSTSAGGFLAGFESTTEATSRLADRTLLMDSSGRLVYGWWDTNPQNIITSPRPYNDGQWHHVALTATRHGSQQQSTLYVDGAEVASGRTSKVETYDGWWRAGSGTVSPRAGIPNTFDGLIDNIAIYDKALSADRIQAHWAAR